MSLITGGRPQSWVMENEAVCYAKQVLRVKVRLVCSLPFHLVTAMETVLWLGLLSMELCCNSAGFFQTTAHFIFLPLSDSLLMERSTICYISISGEKIPTHLSRACGGRSATFCFILPGRPGAMRKATGAALYPLGSR